LQVPGIRSDTGVIPIQSTPFVDVIQPTGTDPGKVVFWLIDMDLLVWKGVYPYGGTATFNPQIFEVSQYLNTEPLVEKRLSVCYGTLYALNLGDGIWKVEVDAPDNAIWSQIE
jgi:hypothetical protein